MRLLFDVAHPAHVHLFRNLIARVRGEGGDVLVAARDKDVAIPLLSGYGIPHVALTRAGHGIARNFAELALRTLRLRSIARRFRPDALLGSSASFGLIGRLIGRPSFIFGEDDADVVPLFAKVAYPLATWIVTPACLRHEDYGPRHLTYPGYHELAYLHPAHFKPDPAVPARLGLRKDEPYFVVRLVALRAHHDVRARGLDPDVARRLVALLAESGRVLVTSEGPLQPELERHRFPLPPESLHDVLAGASLVIGDSQTLIAEAAVLGVPNLRCNSFVGRLSYLRELEDRWGLTQGIRVEEMARLLTLAREWLGDLEGLRRAHQERRRRMLETCIDVSDWQWRTLREKLA
jgi:predicted glycosyltransferase